MIGIYRLSRSTTPESFCGERSMGIGAEWPQIACALFSSQVRYDFWPSIDFYDPLVPTKSLIFFTIWLDDRDRCVTFTRDSRRYLLALCSSHHTTKHRASAL
jgi:hypothetical protein